jgi:hypothetical protein
MTVVLWLLQTLRASMRMRAALQLEILALRHQLHVLKRSRARRVRVTNSDRLLWIWLSRVWQGWRAAIVIVAPETVIAWHRRGFRLFCVPVQPHCASPHTLKGREGSFSRCGWNFQQAQATDQNA